MPVNKRKKATRMRGKTTHGYGSKKKHRGAGNRGGRGMAGSGKRADQKKPTILKLYGNAYYGKRGFKPVKRKEKKIINLDYINEHCTEKEGVLVFDATKYDKVLAKGKITKKIKVICKSISEKAKAKITQAGGEVVCP
jgi:large subunit ribosomal protein L15